MHRVHYFDSSEQAYDACLDDAPCIEEGDIVAILSEGVIGLSSTDPVVVTLEAGALRHVRPMPMTVILTELVHDAVQLRRAVETALRHHLPVEPHFLGFAAPVIPFPHGQTVVALTFDDIMVAVDAIGHRLSALRRRAVNAYSESAEALFLSRAVDQLVAARIRLQRHPRPDP